MSTLQDRTISIAIPKPLDPLEVVKEVYWLAWKASKVIGMGILQNRPDATKDEVWKNVLGREDYSRGGKEDPNRFHGDYVFGRCMKLRLSISGRYVIIPNSPTRGDFETWNGLYPSYTNLVEAAIKSVGESQ